MYPLEDGNTTRSLLKDNRLRRNWHSNENNKVAIQSLANKSAHVYPVIYFWFGVIVSPFLHFWLKKEIYYLFYIIFNIKSSNFIKISDIFLMNKAKIGHIIQQRRDFLAIKQEDLSEMTGITSKTIYLIESGKGNPSIDTLNKLLDVLGLEISIDIKKMNE